MGRYSQRDQYYRISVRPYSTTVLSFMTDRYVRKQPVRQTSTICSIQRRQAEDRRMAVDITRSQNSRWEVRMIRRIGKMLGFQAERGVLREYMPVASGHGSIERVAGVQMDAGLCGQDIEHATADRIDQARCGA